MEGRFEHAGTMVRAPVHQFLDYFQSLRPEQPFNVNSSHIKLLDMYDTWFIETLQQDWEKLIVELVESAAPRGR